MKVTGAPKQEYNLIPDNGKEWAEKTYFSVMRRNQAKLRSCERRSMKRERSGCENKDYYVGCY